MSTCESVDLPEPFGPMSACTSPDRTSRSTPRRISCPATVACRFVIFSTLIGRLPPIREVASPQQPCAVRTTQPWGWGRSRGAHDHVGAVDADVVDRDRAGGGEALGRAVDEREGGTVARALDLTLVLPHVALGQRVVLVRALVADHVEGAL